MILRGNSGSGKSTVAKALRAACGQEMARVSQDLIRPVILKEKDRPGAVNIGMIDQVARYALDRGYHVVASSTPTGMSRYWPGCAATIWACPGSTTWTSA